MPSRYPTLGNGIYQCRERADPRTDKASPDACHSSSESVYAGELNQNYQRGACADIHGGGDIIGPLANTTLAVSALPCLLLLERFVTPRWLLGWPLHAQRSIDLGKRQSMYFLRTRRRPLGSKSQRRRPGGRNTMEIRQSLLGSRRNAISMRAHHLGVVGLASFQAQRRLARLKRETISHKRFSYNTIAE